MKIIAIALAAAAFLPAPIQARESANVVRISYADLNLASAAGVRALDRRLATAVRAVCADARGTEELARLSAAHRCVAVTTAALAAERNRAIAAATAPAELAAGMR